MRYFARALGLLLVCVASPLLAVAQEPPATCPCPPVDTRPFKGSAGFGAALNRGNSDTTNLNLTFEATYDPKRKDVWKAQALYQRGETDGVATVDRHLLQGRYERNLSERAFLFAQLPYLRDEFKEITYLVAPGGGIGYKLIATPAVTLAVDGGAGAKWEKNPGFDVDTSGMITVGDRFDWKLSPSATITQAFSGLLNADELGDALYTFAAGLSTTVATRIELKVEALDTYSTRPPNPTVEKNDVALITALVFKF